MPEQEYTVVVALANPDTVEQLLRTAVDLAREHDGRIHAVTVVHKPPTSPFLLFDDEHVRKEFSGDREEILGRAREAVDVPITTDLLVDNDVASAIRDVATSVGADILLVGWQNCRRPEDVLLGTTVDPLLRRPPCDVLVERVGTIADGVDSILLPTVEGPHVDLTAEVATAIARANDARVAALSVASSREETDGQTGTKATVRTTGERLGDVPVDHHIATAPTPAEGIVDAATEHDVVVLGATTEGLIRPTVIGSVAETVGREVECPVVIGKRPTGSRFGFLSVGSLFRS